MSQDALRCDALDNNGSTTNGKNYVRIEGWGVRENV